MNRYIGARYVTKVYENSNDPSSAEWESNTSYEPLTMVTYNYSSFLSRKHVPNNIGNPVDNPTYWAQTGFYNGQISQLQQNVSDLDSRVDTLEDLRSFTGRKFVFIGDSYNSVTVGGGWGEILKSTWGLTEGVDVWNKHTDVGGHNFHDGTFLSDLQTITSGFTQAQYDAITDIVVVGAINDYQASASDVVSGVRTFESYVKNHFTNARLFIILGGWGASVSNMRENTLTNYRYIYQAATFGRVYFSFQNLLNPKAMYSDQVHPTDTLGMVELTTSIRNILLGGGPYINPVMRSTVFTNISVSTDIYNVEGYIAENGVHVKGTLVGGSFDDASPATLEQANEVIIATAAGAQNGLFLHECYFPARALCQDVNNGVHSYFDHWVNVHIYRGTGADINTWFMAVKSIDIKNGSYNVPNITNIKVTFDVDLGYIN